MCFYFIFCCNRNRTQSALALVRRRLRTIENPSSRVSSRFDRNTNQRPSLAASIYSKGNFFLLLTLQPIYAVLLRLFRKFRSHLSRTYFVALPQYARRGIFRFTPPPLPTDRRAYYLVAIIRAQKKRVSHNCPKSTHRYPHKPCCCCCSSAHHSQSVRVRFRRPKRIRQSLSHRTASPLPSGCFANFFFYFRGQ